MPAAHHGLVNVYWLIKLRWVAAVGQLLTVVAVTQWLKISIPMLWAIVVLILLTTISNLILSIWLTGRKYHRAAFTGSHDLILGAVLIMDLLSLSTLLFATGGPNNPFSLFFFVNLSLCAIMLDRVWAWFINLLTLLCYIGLMFAHHPLEPLNLGFSPIRDTGLITISHTGMIVAFATCSSVIVYFVTRLTGELKKQQLLISEAQAHQAISEKMEALGTLAAGAAHELATPLTTIAVIARDVEQAMVEHPPEFPGADELVDDVHLIRSQLDRCRSILDRMASHAGQTIGESIEQVTISQLSQTAMDGLIGHDRVELHLPENAHRETIAVPLTALSQALRGLIQNALDADPSPQPVSIEVTKLESDWCWLIVDQGVGMSEATLNRVSEPFFTTKPPGSGMGLGLFLARNVIHRLGGSLQIYSQQGHGTQVSVKLPIESEPQPPSEN